jgi:S-formylglutathione hydrolase FrmB
MVKERPLPTITMRKNCARFLGALLLVSCCIPTSSLAQKGRVVEARVHSPALQHNLLGDSAEQRVFIYLPSDYESTTTKRYPVVYILHGFSMDHAIVGQWAEVVSTAMNNLGSTIPPMIVVIPNGQDAYMGSFYVNSATTGNWEDYITHELVSYVDSHYRTLAGRESRGVAGHSMGGFGAINIGLKHPDVFSVVYAESPCCLDMVGDLTATNPAWRRAMQLKTRAEFNQAVQTGEFWPVAMIALAAALSPNPARAPMYLDLPYREDNGQLVPNEPAYTQWQSKMPNLMLGSHRANLLKLQGLFVDYGIQDEFSHIREGVQEFSQALAVTAVPHTLMVFEGDHNNRAPEHVSGQMMPFFGRTLKQ